MGGYSEEAPAAGKSSMIGSQAKEDSLPRTGKKTDQPSSKGEIETDQTEKIDPNNLNPRENSPNNRPPNRRKAAH